MIPSPASTPRSCAYSQPNKWSEHRDSQLTYQNA